MIKKSQKSSYKVIKRWCLITLFLAINKVVDIIIAYRLITVTKTVRVLSKTQIRNYLNHSTEHVLNLITSQVQTVKESKCHIASLDSLIIKSAFDTVNNT